jgi:hypothetical protein
MRLHPDLNCKQCFVKNCGCECDTCLKAKDRNDILTQRELDLLNLSATITAGRQDGEKKSI